MTDIFLPAGQRDALYKALILTGLFTLNWMIAPIETRARSAITRQLKVTKRQWPRLYARPSASLPSEKLVGSLVTHGYMYKGILCWSYGLRASRIQDSQTFLSTLANCFDNNMNKENNKANIFPTNFMMVQSIDSQPCMDYRSRYKK